jgi:capsid protein
MLHIDPETEAKADEIRLANCTQTLKDYWAAQGADWKEKIRQAALEKKYKQDLGLPTYDEKEKANAEPAPKRKPGPAAVGAKGRVRRVMSA